MKILSYWVEHQLTKYDCTQEVEESKTDAEVRAKTLDPEGVWAWVAEIPELEV